MFLISAGGISLLLFMAWNFHCHRVYAEAEFPTINMDASDGKSNINHWYFGTLAFRLDFHNWLRGSWLLATAVFGGFSFIFLFLVSACLKKTTEAWLWIWPRRHNAGIHTIGLGTFTLFLHFCPGHCVAVRVLPPLTL